MIREPECPRQDNTDMGFGTVKVIRNGKRITLAEAERIDAEKPWWKFW